MLDWFVRLNAVSGKDRTWYEVVLFLSNPPDPSAMYFHWPLSTLSGDSKQK
jgi:hypothetical protein